MKIYAIFEHPEAGWDADIKTAKESGLVVGEKYELYDASVGSWQTDIYLEGFYDVFNSVQFEFVDELGNEVDIYKMPEFKSYW